MQTATMTLLLSKRVVGNWSDQIKIWRVSNKNVCIYTFGHVNHMSLTHTVCVTKKHIHVMIYDSRNVVNKEKVITIKYRWSTDLVQLSNLWRGHRSHRFRAHKTFRFFIKDV